jgi:hypothetical protein
VVEQDGIAMERMRDVLRGSLGKSLRGVQEQDRLAAAWTVACGSAMANHGRVIGYDAGMVRVAVADDRWMRQMYSLRGQLERDLAKISGLPVAAIRFELEKD